MHENFSKTIFNVINKSDFINPNTCPSNVLFIHKHAIQQLSNLFGTFDFENMDENDVNDYEDLKDEYKLYLKQRIDELFEEYQKILQHIPYISIY